MKYVKIIKKFTLKHMVLKFCKRYNKCKYNFTFYNTVFILLLIKINRYHVEKKNENNKK